MTFTYSPEILTHGRYRMVCDDCEWVSTNNDSLSVLVVEMNEHRAKSHAPVYVAPTVPTRPVLVSVSGIK